EAMADDGFGDDRGARRLTALAQHRVARAAGRRWLDVLAAGYTARFDEPGTVALADYEAGRLGFYDGYGHGGDGASDRALVAARAHDESAARSLDGRLYAQWRRLRLRENFTGYLVHPEQGDLRGQRH